MFEEEAPHVHFVLDPKNDVASPDRTHYDERKVAFFFLICILFPVFWDVCYSNEEKREEGDLKWDRPKNKEKDQKEEITSDERLPFIHEIKISSGTQSEHSSLKIALM